MQQSCSQYSVIQVPVQVQYFSSKYQYQYKYLKMVLKYRSSTSTSTQYYNPAMQEVILKLQFVQTRKSVYSRRVVCMKCVCVQGAVR